MAPALRHGAFRKIAALYSLNCFLEWFGTIALMVVVYGATDSALAATGMLLCKHLVSAAVIPLLGSFLDRSDLGRAAAVSFVAHAAGLATLALWGYGPWVYPVGVLVGVSAGTTRSSLRAAVARTLDGPGLRSGNAFLNAVVAFAMTAGPAAAAAAVSGLGESRALALGAAGLLLLALGAASLRVAPRPELAEADIQPAVEGIARGRGRLPIHWLLFGAGVVMCAFAMDEPVLLMYSERALGAGVGGYGAIYAAWGVGLAIGSLIFARLLERSMVDVWLAATLLNAAAYLGLGVSPTIEISCLVAVVGGIGNGICWVALVTAVQEAAPVGREASITARLEALSTGAPAVGILLGGVVGGLLGARAALLLPGAVVLVLVLSAALALRARQPRTPRLVPGLVSPSAPGGSV